MLCVPDVLQLISVKCVAFLIYEYTATYHVTLDNCVSPVFSLRSARSCSCSFIYLFCVCLLFCA